MDSDNSVTNPIPDTFDKFEASYAARGNENKNYILHLY